MPSFARDKTPPENVVPQLDAGVRKQSKFKRMRLTKAQTHLMEGIFQRDHYPSTEHSMDIARSLNCPLHSIQIWFQNRRAKERRCGDGSIQLIPPRLARQLEQARAKREAGAGESASDHESQGSSEQQVPTPASADGFSIGAPFFPGTSVTPGNMFSASVVAPARVDMDVTTTSTNASSLQNSSGVARQFTPDDMRAVVAAAFAAGNASAYANALAALAAGQNAPLAASAPHFATPTISPTEYASAFAAMTGQFVYPPPVASISKLTGLLPSVPHAQGAELPAAWLAAMSAMAHPMNFPPMMSAPYSRAMFERSTDPFYAAPTSERESHVRAARALEAMGHRMGVNDDTRASSPPTSTAAPADVASQQPKSERKSRTPPTAALTSEDAAGAGAFVDFIMQQQAPA